MTNEEARKEIKDASDEEVRYGDTEHHYAEVMKRVEAFDMANKALEQQPSEDCISREEALKVMCDKCPVYDCITKCSSYTHIEKMPSVTLKQKVGKWTCTDDMDEWYGKLFRCSVCGAKVLEADRYCPYCGARMEVEE